MEKYFIYTKRAALGNVKDDSQVAYIPDIEVRIKAIRSSVYTLITKDKKERQVYKVFKSFQGCFVALMSLVPWSMRS